MPSPSDPPVSTRARQRTPELVVLALVVLLGVGAGVLGGGDGGGRGAGAAAHGARAAARLPSWPRAASVVSARRIALIERRVERLRGLRFLHPVRVAVISPAQTRRLGLAEAHRTVSAAAQRTQEEVLKLVALLPARDDLEHITGAIYGEQVAGFYDPRRKRLALVRGAGVDDITLAHELTHALEDQHFETGRPGARSDDAHDAYSALLEGTATEVMLRYALRYPDSAPSAGDAIGALAQTTGGTPLPPHVMRTLLFPYLAGRQFVASLVGGKRGWSLVNVALRYRPPISTAEALDVGRWLRVQRPLAVAPLRAAGSVLGAGWRRLDDSSLGEEDTIELLYSASGAARAGRIAAGWRGGRAELWRRGPLPAPGCAAPCHARDVLVLAWRMGSPRAARSLGAGLERWLRGDVQAAPVGGGGWRVLGGSGAALRVSGTGVRVVLAPTVGLARRVAASR